MRDNKQRTQEVAEGVAAAVGTRRVLRRFMRGRETIARRIYGPVKYFDCYGVMLEESYQKIEELVKEAVSISDTFRFYQDAAGETHSDGIDYLPHIAQIPMETRDRAFHGAAA